MDTSNVKWLNLSTGGWVTYGTALNNFDYVVIPATSVTVTDDYVNVRSEPSVGADKVARLQRGQRVSIVMTAQNGTWGYCSQGWIFLAYTDYTAEDSGASGQEKRETG